MGEVTWTSYGSWTTALSTDLDGLADDGLAISSAIDNSANKDLFVDIEVYLASVDLSSSTNPAIYIWLIARSDGTNFEDGGSSVEPARAPDAIIPLREGTGAMTQRVFARMLMATPDQFKILVQNKAGAALAASGNTIKYNTYGETVA